MKEIARYPMVSGHVGGAPVPGRLSLNPVGFPRKRDGKRDSMIGRGVFLLEEYPDYLPFTACCAFFARSFAVYPVTCRR